MFTVSDVEAVIAPLVVKAPITFAPLLVAVIISPVPLRCNL